MNLKRSVRNIFVRGSVRGSVRRYYRPPFMEPLLFRPAHSLMAYRDDVGYIGYVTDVDEDEDSSLGAGAGGGSVEGAAPTMNVVSRRRRYLLALDSDVGFSESVCLFVIVSFAIALFLFLVAASPWGVSPPSLGGGGSRRR
jgi:hypothetical protein